MAKILTSWPLPVTLAVVVIVIILRKPIANLIDRIKSLKTPGGVELTAATKQETAPSSAAPTKPASPLAPVPIPLPLMKYDSLIVRIIGEALKAHLETNLKDDHAAREKYLLDVASDALGAGAYEHVYSLIYGSQLAVVRDLNSAGVVPITQLRRYY